MITLPCRKGSLATLVRLFNRDSQALYSGLKRQTMIGIRNITDMVEAGKPMANHLQRLAIHSACSDPGLSTASIARYIPAEAMDAQHLLSTMPQ